MRTKEFDGNSIKAFFALPVINPFSLILCYVYSFKIDRLIGSIACVRASTYNRAARGLFDANLFAGACE